MTQQDVFKQLLKEKDWISTKDLADKLGLSYGSVCANLNSMRNYDEVESKFVKIGDSHHRKYIHKLTSIGRGEQ